METKNINFEMNAELYFELKELKAKWRCATWEDLMVMLLDMLKKGKEMLDVDGFTTQEGKDV